MALSAVRTVADLRRHVKAWREAGLSIGFVPTMGALHRGHLRLVETALAEADRVVASIFVNPTQFGPNEDFSRYPRQEAEDAAQLEKAGAHLLFAPGVDEMYRPGAATTVSVAGLTDVLCGPLRPGHFDGVATVVTKLLNQVQPDRAFFGQKDFQQLQVIRRFVADLDMPVAIRGVPTVREADGLALSSRNLYLSPKERDIAARLPETLRLGCARLAAGEDPMEVCRDAAERLLAFGFDSIDYVEAREGETLAPAAAGSPAARIFAAVRLGKTRLIDNMAVAEEA